MLSVPLDQLDFGRLSTPKLINTIQIIWLNISWNYHSLYKETLELYIYARN